MTKRATNEELQDRHELAAYLLSRGQAGSIIVDILSHKYKVTPQQARSYKKAGEQIFKETRAGDGTVADAVEMEYFILLDNLKEDRLAAKAADNHSAVASLDATRLKHLDMSVKMSPMSTAEKELNDHYVQLCNDHISEKLGSPKGKIPRQRLSDMDDLDGRVDPITGLTTDSNGNFIYPDNNSISNISCPACDDIPF